MRLKDKIAIVTGAASGMGACTAELFAKEGAKVMLTDVTEDDGQAVAARIEASGGAARFLRHDVSSEDDWQSVVAETVSAWGGLDVLVNNAGLSGSDPDIFSTEVWDRMMGVNAKGVFLGMKHGVQAMQASGGGSIINISSISGFVGQRYVHMGYNASKGAVRIATKSAAVQFARDGIRVNSVHPGVMPPMRSSMLTADPEVRERMLKGIPMRREGRIEEVAYTTLFLASDEASYITGVEIPVDGGYLAL